MNIRNILILVDLSETTPSLLRYGVQLASSLSAQTWIQHVYYFPPDLAGDVLIPADAIERYEAQARQKLEKLKKSVAELTKMPLYSIVVRGDLTVQTNRLIEQRNIDLVVVGNRGGGLTTNILGNNTLKLIYHARCPVLSVPDQISFEPFRRIAFATDWQQTTPKNVNQLKGLVKFYDADLDIIHVSTDEKPAAENLNEPYHLKDIPYTLHYLWDKDIEEGLQKHVTEHQTNLLVLIPHQHSFFDRLFQKSITRQMVYHTHIPLLTLHE